MKKPTKKELYRQIDQLIAERDREKRAAWERRIPKARAVFDSTVGKVFPGMLRFVELEHIDEAGYWFTFQLINDDTRQRYAVRHYELND